MAKFHIGQRVKCIEPSPRSLVPIGAEGVVLALIEGGQRYRVDFPAYKSNHSSGYWGCFSYQLAPLTDPLAEKFIETVKLWGPLKEKEVA